MLGTQLLPTHYSHGNSGSSYPQPATGRTAMPFGPDGLGQERSKKKPKGNVRFAAPEVRNEREELFDIGEDSEDEYENQRIREKRQEEAGMDGRS